MRFDTLHGCKPITDYTVKPCPFCGGEAMMLHTERWSGVEAVVGYTVICVETKCVIFSADNQYYRTEERAIKRWNDRKGEDDK